MTTFDKLKGAAATLADAAVKTTGDLAQKGKKQMDLLALENKLSRAQRQLGALVYALHKNGEENTALVERYIETIAAVEKDIAALEQDLLDVLGLKVSIGYRDGAGEVVVKYASLEQLDDICRRLMQA